MSKCYDIAPELDEDELAVTMNAIEYRQATIQNDPYQADVGEAELLASAWKKLDEQRENPE